jgi:hypothetical protein
MTNPMTKRRYRSTEAKYKGGAQEMYVTYDLHQKTRGAQSPPIIKSGGYV